MIRLRVLDRRGDLPLVAAFHRCRQCLLSVAQHGAMLDSYALNAFYLNVVRPCMCLCRREGRRVQVGGRRRRCPLQRPATRERREGCAESAPDIHRSATNSGASFFRPPDACTPGIGLSELCHLLASARSGVHERVGSHCGSKPAAYDSTRRSGRRDLGWSAPSRCSRVGRPVRNHSYRPRHAFSPAGRARRKWTDRVPVVQRDLPRSSAIRSVPNGARPAEIVSTPRPATGTRVNTGAGRGC